MTEPTIVPPSISDESNRAFEALAERFSGLDLTKLLIYRTSEVDASALPTLAWQFHVRGREGWNLARTDAQQRAMIEGSIPLHRTKGTPAAVEGALHRLGYPSAQVIERVGEYETASYRHNGLIQRDGVSTYRGGRMSADRRWATFRVAIDIDDLPTAGANLPDIYAVISEFKRGSVWLTDVSFSGDVLEDPLHLTDAAEVAVGPEIIDGFPNVPRHDGRYRRGGAAFAYHDGARLRNGNWLYDQRGRPIGTEIYYGAGGWTDEFEISAQQAIAEGFAGPSRRNGALRFDGQARHDAIQPALQEFLDLEWIQVEPGDAGN